MKALVKLSLLFFLLLESCNRKSDAYYKQLGAGYFYASSSNRGMIYKGVLGNTSTYKLIITGNVEECNFDNNYITAFRHITPLEFRDSATNYLFQNQFNGDTLQYWIISKVNDSLYGPYQKNEFIHKKKMLGVSPSSKLKNE